jgi:DNA-binding HxlR family transcriptional regulator
LVLLCHRRWSLPLLALLGEGPGRRFAEFQRKLGVSRQPLRDNLDALIVQGLVVRHAGHGHPLRPEYVLSGKGRELAPAVGELWSLLQRRDLVTLSARKWPLPVLAGIGDGARRFGEIGKLLPGLGPRALALALKALEAAALIDRTVSEEHPPGVSYALNPAGRGIARRIEPLLD